MYRALFFKIQEEIKMKRFLAVILVMIIAMACFAGCEVSEESGEETTGEQVCEVGKSLSTDALEFTFVGVEKYVDNSDWVLDKPAEGKEFVIFKIKVKNISEKDKYINMLYEESYCDDVAVDTVSTLFNYNGESLWGNVAAGRAREGYVAYEVPVGWNKIEFTYEEILGDNKVTLVAYSTDVKSSSNADNNEDKPVVNEPEKEDEQPSAKPSANECRVGETVKCKDLEFTFLGIEKYVDDSDWALDKPAEGKEFVILKIKIKNVGAEDEYINMYYEDSYCDDVSVDPELLLYNYEGNTIWGDVAAGRAREGYIAYELPIGWEKIEFTYTFSLLSASGDKVVLVGYSSEIN